MSAGENENPAAFAIGSGLLRVDRCRHGVFVSLKPDMLVGRSLAIYGRGAESAVPSIR